VRLPSGSRRGPAQLGCDDFASLFLGKVFQLGNIVRRPAFECLIGHEQLLLSGTKILNSTPDEKFRTAENADSGRALEKKRGHAGITPHGLVRDCPAPRKNLSPLK
jgi:hypothetical protein